ncbi:MAG: insulinase family protein [Altererythrobacter sp.]|nr:insulinase family protein [Altererythrobacter sp.]
MTRLTRAARHFALLLPLTLVAPQLAAQEGDPLPPPESIQAQGETPWLYEGSDVPQDKEWLFGEMDNGLRYAVRDNGVPPGQVSIRIRIDAGSLHEEEAERGFAHLMEHLSFRESKYLAFGEAIPTWQRLGATFGSDTNASTTPTETVYKLDLPNATPAALEESFKLLSGMMREPVLNQTNVSAEVPIVLAEKRERGGAAMRVVEKTRQTLFAGQRLANRLPIGTEETLLGATPEALQAFHDRWYRPENTVISVAGDADPLIFASLIERYFADWQGKGARVEAPEFGDPVAPEAADPANPIGEVAVMVEPDFPRVLNYSILRPWRQVNDTVVYNEGKLRGQLAEALINRRLEAKARAGGSFLDARVSRDSVSRSADMTSVEIVPLSEDWQAALGDVRAVIADATDNPPTQEEIDRELAEFEIAFVSLVEQSSVLPGSALADEIVGAVDIREAIASPQTFLDVFRSMRKTATPANLLEKTRELFEGDVIRATYMTPSVGEAEEASLRVALQAPVTADPSARLAAKQVSFDDLPPIGTPGTIVRRGPIGIHEIEQIEFSNGTRALLWQSDAEPGRVAVKMRFGAGNRAFGDDDAAYIQLGRQALVSSGLGELGQEELDRITTGRRMGFGFGIDDAVFTFTAQTRGQDLADQLYLFAGKLAMPRWDANPVLREKAALRLTYESQEASPMGVLGRDLEYILSGNEGRFASPTPEQIEAATPEGFRKLWEPLLAQGNVEILVFGEFDTDETIEALKKTIGALPPRKPIPADVAARIPGFPADRDETVVLTHRGDADQAAAVVAWEAGGGFAQVRESRQLQILTDLFNNRLIDTMRERAGASYAPNVGSSWPLDIDGGGTITALAQLKPEDVPVFFDAAQGIAHDLATSPVTPDELARVTEPLNQTIRRASTGNTFWLFQLEGATTDPRRIFAITSLLADYTVTTPEAMQALAAKYFGDGEGVKVAIIPKGQELADTIPAARQSAIIGR